MGNDGPQPRNSPTVAASNPAQLQAMYVNGDKCAQNERPRHAVARPGSKGSAADGAPEYQWNCFSAVEPDKAFTLEEPPWITVVTSSK
jgi:hypothetical protein